MTVHEFICAMSEEEMAAFFTSMLSTYEERIVNSIRTQGYQVDLIRLDPGLQKRQHLEYLKSEMEERT